MQLSSDENSINFLNVPSIFSSSNPLSLNHSIKYAQELKLLPSNLDDVNLAETYSFTEEEITSAVNANYPEPDPQSDPSTNPSTSQYQEGQFFEDNLEKNSDFFNFPSFPNDPSVDEVNFEDLFNVN